jgi:molybdopterin converting factor small subunit
MSDIRIEIPPPYRPYTKYTSVVSVAAGTVTEAFSALFEIFPELRKHIQNPKKEIRPFINIFVNGKNIKSLQGLNTTLEPGDIVQFIPSIAGG